ncbi:MAG TPA: 23S rRNA (pseudouridine(1915)-N(3))-methyltransferase RlmH [Cytophagaceae bacterium]|jgi:23S rRNA (pseudouridine1915-N3)-methyltransferase|nr:23S rRNA (pseudouridine(1915)-N(3))-methyltransferase RlmH [Cytophagaceae bacterium]
MKIKLLVVGKTDEKYLCEGIDKFFKRINHYIKYEIEVIADVKQGSKLNTGKIKEEEGKLILKRINLNDQVILLDEKGLIFTSTQFSGFLQKKINGGANLIFVVGGPFGFSKEIYERANEKISLSAMTFSHQMIRLFFNEQLYRAFTILKGEKYHHD